MAIVSVGKADRVTKVPRTQTTGKSDPKTNRGQMVVLLSVSGGEAEFLSVLDGLVVRNERALEDGASPPVSTVKNRLVYREEPLWRDAVSANEDSVVSSGSLAAWMAAEHRVKTGDRFAKVGMVGGIPAVVHAEVGNIHVIQQVGSLFPKRSFYPRPLVGAIDRTTGEITETMHIRLDDDLGRPVREIGDAIAHHNARMIERGYPALYSSDVRYKTEGSPELWWDVPRIVREGHDDCEGLAAYRAGELILLGHDAHVHTRLIPKSNPKMGGKGGGRLFHAVTRIDNADGTTSYDDPSRILGMPIPAWYPNYLAGHRDDYAPVPPSSQGLQGDMVGAVPILSSVVDVGPDGPLTTQQLQMIDLIEFHLTSAGWPLSVAAAAVVNAAFESRLDPNAVSPSKSYVGLFQIGPAHGMSTAQRKNPSLAMAWLLKELEIYGLPLLRAADQGASVKTLAGLFSKYIERPGNVATEMRNRQLLATKMFPAQATLAIHEADRESVVADSSSGPDPISPRDLPIQRETPEGREVYFPRTGKTFVIETGKRNSRPSRSRPSTLVLPPVRGPTSGPCKAYVDYALASDPEGRVFNANAMRLTYENPDPELSDACAIALDDLRREEKRKKKEESLVAVRGLVVVGKLG